MTATLDDVTKKKQPEPTAEAGGGGGTGGLARAQGLALTGPDGLLKQLTKTVLETALNEEMTGHLGHEKHDPAEPGRGSGNVRNGTRPKTVLTERHGQVCIDVPRDREGTFEPQIVKKRQRRLTDVDEIVLSLYAKGLTTGEISAHFAEIYGASISRETVSRITEKVVAEMQEWETRPLDAVYVAVFIDAIVVKVRDGQVANRPVYAAIGVTTGRPQGRAGPVGRYRRGGRQVLDERAHRPEKPRGQGRVLPGVRRAERPARGGGGHMAARHCPDVYYPSHPQYVPAHLPRRCGHDQAGHQAHLHRAHRGRGVRGAGRTGGEMG